jgi:tripartite-type tricarboxylate transporter receptor subunit TctC
MMRPATRTPVLDRRRAIQLGAAFAAGSLGLAGGVAAQAWPSKPLKLIAPYPPGGGVDNVARLVAEKLAVRLGQPVVVENKPGAGATIGGDALAKSPADGYTVMIGSMVDYSLSPHFNSSLPFDMAKDFVAVVDIGFGTGVLVVPPEVPAGSVKALIDMAKAKPGELKFASSGQGGLTHLNGEMFKQITGIDAVHVPYKGTSQLLPDLLSGRVQYTIDSLPAHLPHIKAGRLKALGVTSAKRSALLPDVPTLAEAGVTGFESATNYTLFAPAATPKEIVARLNAELNAILEMADVRERLATAGIAITGGTTEAAQAKVPLEMKRWASVIKTGNIKAD